MGALIGLGIGTGLLLIWSAVAMPRTPRQTSPTRTDPLTELLARAGIRRLGARGLVLLCALTGLVGAVIVQAVTATPPISIAFALISAYLPIALVRGRARRRHRELSEVWPEAVDNLASAVRAGMSLAEAVAALGIRGPAPLRPAFGDFALDYQVTGRFADSLDRLKQALADPTGDRVVEGLRVAREVGGGDLGRLLRNLSGYLREEARVRGELEARQAWTVNGARLAVAAPWLVLLMMSSQSEAIRRYNSTTGVIVLAFGGAMCALAYWLMIRIGRLPVEQRILR